MTLTPAIVSLASDYIPRAEEVVVDWTVLLFALGRVSSRPCSQGRCPLAGAQDSPADALGDGARTTAGVRSRRISHWLVVAEIALAFALLAVSAVLVAALAAVVADGARFRRGRAPDVHRQPARDRSRTTTPGELRRSGSIVEALQVIPGVTASRLRTTCRSTVAASRRRSSRMGSHGTAFGSADERDDDQPWVLPGAAHAAPAWPAVVRTGHERRSHRSRD